ncbi:MAG TPA: N-acetylmuramoyl-L-alanine amidase, partial [Verrucomicrobiota bacterium]|nr:N-acetylmuramoyl-L-alanine amidase [Verrucomicrobiota bacterium]
MFTKIIGLALGAVCLLVVTAPASAAPAATTRINGTDYVRFSEWTKSSGLGWGWIKRDSTLYATNRSTRFLFIANSREAQVNNIQVWLLHPLVNRSGALYISKLDTTTTLQPLISPPRNAAGRKVKTICIDPGHGGKDPGNRVGTQFEKEYTLRLARELRDQLTKAGFTVTLTRTGDTFLDLPRRPAIANQRKADLFISLHFNAVASSRNTVKGAETFVLTPAGARSTSAPSSGPTATTQPGNRFNSQNMLLGYEIQRQLVRTLKTTDRGVRRARFAILRDAEMPAVLVEAGFLSHPSEGKKIMAAAYRREMAKAITDGVLA